MTRARFGGDESLMGEVARVFTRTAPQLLSSIGAALNKNDLKRVAEAGAFAQRRCCGFRSAGR
jgi:hypothetical protein